MTSQLFSNGIPNSRRGAFTLWELIAVLVILAVLIALLLPALQSPRSTGPRSHCKNNLKQIALALHNYSDTYGGFPPAYTTDENGRPLHSWRTLLLPFVDQAPLYRTIDLTKPWDDPVNAEALGTVVRIYQCPGAKLKGNLTTYAALVGEDHFLHPERSREISEMEDGTSDTIAVVEVRPQEAFPWMQPRDEDVSFFQDLNPKTEFAHVGGTHALFADRAVRFLSNETPSETTAALATIAGGDEVGEY
ncbi:MAG: DUF1559 domain-containing protein [Planctomycetaceae bacterium]|nr:DUF1559 domain-containing protein [Planctomycetaceae bacterium]